jgi:pre-mRNA-processing factor 40
VCAIFDDHPLWRAVHPEERKDVYDDVVFALTEKEKEQEKQQRERNRRVIAKVLHSMTSITYRTTWNEALKMIPDSRLFKKDEELKEMDKEDMLIAFEDHIRGLEREEDDGKQKDRERERRKFRKNRDAFLVLLDELHSSGKLTSVSLWKERYALISSDHRYHSMLGQPGSTPLDLFKFYVEDLKARLYDEKKIIKEILKDTGYEVEVETTFDQFTAHIASDPRSDSLDRGNMKLTFASVRILSIASPAP